MIFNNMVNTITNLYRGINLITYNYNKSIASKSHTYIHIHTYIYILPYTCTQLICYSNSKYFSF